LDNARLKALVLALIALAMLSSPICAQTEEFAMGAKFYEDKDYKSAIRMYESALSMGAESAALYYNLGGAYFKDGDLGQAVLNYHRARRLDPTDSDIRQNLEFASQFSRVRMEGVELNPINAFFNSIVENRSLDSLGWISSALFIAFMLTLIFRLGFSLNLAILRTLTVATLTLTIITAGLTTFKYRTDYLSRRAVIISEDAPVNSGPSDNSELELQGASGLVVDIVEESSEWYNVLFENKRRGWIRKELVTEI
jgi:tetratricopeptide (TPR) repeat protein